MAINLKNKNIRIITYHPDYSTSYPNLVNILTKLYSNSNNIQAYGFTQHAVAVPYFDPTKTSWIDPTWSEVVNNYANIGITDKSIEPNFYKLSQGFIYYYNSGFGWKPADWRAYMINHPEFKSAWFFTGVESINTASNEFGQLQPLT
mgnify:FL=1